MCLRAAANLDRTTTSLPFRAWFLACLKLSLETSAAVYNRNNDGLSTFEHPADSERSHKVRGQTLAAPSRYPSDCENRN